VLIAPKDSTVSLTIAKDFPLLAALGADGKLAMANVDSVPAGKYGKAALSSLAVWDAVSPRVGQAENVRAALTFVAKGETPLSIVYGTDAKSEPAVKVIGTFPEASHPKIQYPDQARSAQVSRLPRIARGAAGLRGTRVRRARRTELMPGARESRKSRLSA
jgi:molybdate transport system substrate-binding protein